MIDTRLREKDWRLKDLSDRLGYRNPVKGDRRLRAIMESFDFLDNQHCEDRIIKRLPEALELPASDVQAAILATWSEYEAHLAAEQIEARRRFKPFIFVHTEFPNATNMPLFIRAICEHLRVIELPDGFAAHPPYMQIEIAKESISRFLDEHDDLPVWGTITGFTLWREIDEGIYFDESGQPDYTHPCTPPASAASLKVNGKKLPPKLVI